MHNNLRVISSRRQSEPTDNRALLAELKQALALRSIGSQGWVSWPHYGPQSRKAFFLGVMSGELIAVLPPIPARIVLGANWKKGRTSITMSELIEHKRIVQLLRVHHIRCVTRSGADAGAAILARELFRQLVR